MPVARRPWTYKPDGLIPEIDWRNTIWSGLKFFAYPLPDGRIIDLVTGEIGQVTAGNPQPVLTEYGIAAETGSTPARVTWPDVPHGIGGKPYSMVAGWRWNGTAGSWQTVMCLEYGNDPGIYLPRRDTEQWMSADSLGSGSISWPSITVSAGEMATFGYATAAGVGQVGYKNGQYVETASGLSWDGGTKGVTLFVGQGSEYAHGALLFGLLYDRVLTDAEWAELTHERVWRHLRPRLTLISLSTSSDLGGNAKSQAIATGDLTTEIPLAGAAVTMSTADGTLSTSIALAGQAQAQVTATGDLTVTITLAGDALAQAVATGGLDTAVSLEGQARAQSTAIGDLTGGTALAGDALAQAIATGSLTTQIQLAGQAIAEALASGDLTVSSGGLAGDARAQASASGSLVTQIPLAGQALAKASAGGGLSTEIPLAGVSAAQATGTGTLDVAITLAGDARADVIAQGSLTTTITLSGTALAQAFANGSLSDGAAHRRAGPGRLGIVWPEARRHTVINERRRASA